MKESIFISLTAQEIIEIMSEKSVMRDNLCISCKDSYLAVLSYLHDEMIKRMPDARSTAL